MTKGYSILQKKLQELESILTQVFALPPDTPYHQHYAEDIEQRFVFLKNLLSAEIASSPKKPHHLQHIGKRMVELATAFHDWDEYRSLTQDQVEKVSTCSCTESCLNDDGGTSPELGSLGFEDPENEFDGLMKEKEPVEMEKIRAEEKISDLKREEKGVGIGIGRFFGSMATGVVIGMVLMGFFTLKFCRCFPYVEHSVCLTPT